MNRLYYTRFPHASAFSGINQLQHIYPNLAKNRIEHDLSTVDAYTRHREPKKPKYNPIYVREKRELLQADLLDKQKLATRNRGVRYYLVVIDTFTRKIWVRPLKNKKGDTVATAFEAVLNEMERGGDVQRLLTDRGTEFTGREFQAVLNRWDIKHSLPIRHAPHVERVQRTIQSLTGKYCTQYETMRFEHIMQLIVASYNKRYHRMIRMSPDSAELPENYEKVRYAMSLYYQKFEKNKKRRQKFVVGDQVRKVLLRKNKNPFFRSFHETFGIEIFRVAEVLKHMPSVMYRLETLDGHPVQRRYYQEELQHVRLAPFKIKKVYRDRTRRNIATGQEEILVGWQGLPASRNSYIPREQALNHRAEHG